MHQVEAIERWRVPVPPWMHRTWAKVSGVVLGLVLLGLLAPVLPLFLGVFLVIAVALHAGVPDMRPYLDTVLRIPVERPARRRQRLLITGAAGLVLILTGTLGAMARSNLRVHWNQPAPVEAPE